MKIKTKALSYEEVIRLKKDGHRNPGKTNPFLKRLIKLFSDHELKKCNFRSESVGMERLGFNEPALVLMNHSSFVDLEIAAKLLYPRPFHIVCTKDGFVGKAGLMRAIGCIPTQKFVTDLNLVKDMKYALKTLKSSVLMYPEASYSFDGTATPLPDSLSKCIKLLDVPVLMIKTTGAFLRDPLYNMLKLRKVDVSASIEYLMSPEDIKEKSLDEINEILKKCFTFDHFKWQKENKIVINEPFRADGLNRVLYKCPHCLSESKMEGLGTKIKCCFCGVAYELDEYGFLKCLTGEGKFDHIPDWFKWERKCVKEELEAGTYRLETKVDICMMVNTDFIYRVGEGLLTHTKEGFHLTGCDGKLDYFQKPSASYSLYSDYYWYEIADMICIGDMKTSYYCFPKGTGDVVAKTRLAAEELYKLDREKTMRKISKQRTLVALFND